MSSNFQLSKWASSFLPPWSWNAVLLPENPSHPLRLNISSVSQVDTVCSVFHCHHVPRRQGRGREGVSVQVNGRAAERVETDSSQGGGACFHYPLCACWRGSPSIHLPTQRGLNPLVASQSVLQVLLGILSYDCLSYLIYYAAIFRNVFVHIFPPFDEIHIFFTLFSVQISCIMGNHASW